jgi:beta-phosphoglucomutase-like phosphatase (HAD superfamily)
VGTAGDRHNIDFTFTRLALTGAPHVVVGGDEGLAGKPDPAIFLAVAQRLGVDAAECIVFEDAPFGIEAAGRAGMRAVAICSSHAPEELSGPHVIAQVRDYHDLITDHFLESLHVA